MQHRGGHPNVWPTQSGAWILPVPLGSTRDGGVVRSAHCPLNTAGVTPKWAEEELSCFPYLSPGAAAVAVQLRAMLLSARLLVCSLMPLGTMRRDQWGREQLQGLSKTLSR